MANSSYSEEIAEQIIDAIIDGKNIQQAAELVGISDRTIYRWSAGMNGAPESFGQQYARAMAIRADRMAEEIIKISDHKGCDIKLDASGLPLFDDSGNPLTDHDHIQRARLQVDTRKFLMGQWNGKYTARLNHGGQQENPIAVKSIKGASDDQITARIAELLAKGSEDRASDAAGREAKTEGDQ